MASIGREEPSWSVTVACSSSRIAVAISAASSLDELARVSRVVGGDEAQSSSGQDAGCVDSVVSALGDRVKRFS